MFKLSAEDRLRSWRDFRNSLEKLPLEQALSQTAELWARTPFSPYYLDINDPTKTVGAVHPLVRIHPASK